MAVRANIRISGLQSLRRRIQIAQREIPEILSDKDGAIAKSLVRSTKKRFDTHIDPDGVSWKPLVRGNFPRFNRNFNDILKNTGKLQRSIGVVSRDSPAAIKTNTGAGLRIGVLGNNPGAGTHQRGGRSPLTGGRIPARPFLGISTTDVRNVSAIINRKLEKALGG